jgi:hypothetical protein
MKTNLQKHTKKARYLERKMKEIEAKYPHINFSDWELIRACQKHYEYSKYYVYERTDAKMCAHENITHRCSDCICAKKDVH